MQRCVEAGRQFCGFKDGLLVLLGSTFEFLTVVRNSLCIYVLLHVPIGRSWRPTTVVSQQLPVRTYILGQYWSILVLEDRRPAGFTATRCVPASG